MYESEIRALKWVDIYSQCRHDKRAVSTWQGSCLRLLLHPPKGFARRKVEGAEGRLTSGFKHNIEKQLGSWKSESMRNQRGSQLNWQTPLLCTPTHTRTLRILSWKATPFQISIQRSTSTREWAVAAWNGNGAGNGMEWQSKKIAKVRGEPKYATMRYNLDPLSDLFVLDVWATQRRFPFGFKCCML